MDKYGKRVLTVLMAVVVVSIIADSASALRSISISPAGAYTATSPSVTFSASFGEVICAVTLEGRLHAGIAKTEGTLAGFVERGRVAARERCRKNFAIRSIDDQPRILFEEFWHIRFVDFEGTLPEITTVRVKLLRARFLVGVTEAFGIIWRCLFTIDARAELPLTRGSSERMDLFQTAARGVALEGSTSPCPEGEFDGSFTMERARAVRLI